MRTKALAWTWCVLVCVVSVASGGSKKPAAASPAASQPAGGGDAAFQAAVGEATSLQIDAAQLREKCLAAYGGQPDATARCQKAHDDMKQCVGSYPGADQSASRQECFALRSSSS